MVAGDTGIVRRGKSAERQRIARRAGGEAPASRRLGYFKRGDDAAWRGNPATIPASDGTNLRRREARNGGLSEDIKRVDTGIMGDAASPAATWPGAAAAAHHRLGVPSSRQSASGASSAAIIFGVVTGVTRQQSDLGMTTGLIVKR